MFPRLQVSLVVNVASECGFTEEHYRELQQLQRDFGPAHFNVLAFPCNQFGQQEPGSDKEIDSFVRRTYGVSFPLFSKIAMVGTGANNVYKYLVGEPMRPTTSRLQWLCNKMQIWKFLLHPAVKSWRLAAMFVVFLLIFDVRRNSRDTFSRCCFFASAALDVKK